MAVSFNVSKPGQRQPRQPKPLDADALNQLALHYVGKYATTRGKLRDYLKRKVRERGWAGDDHGPDIAALAERFSALGYIDDRAFAEMRAESMARRGYGVRRVSQALTMAGIGEEDAVPVRAAAAERGWDSALAYARRKRIGPWSAAQPDPAMQQKQLAAMLRAGHPFDHARRIIATPAGEMPDVPE